MHQHPSNTRPSNGWTTDNGTAYSSTVVDAALEEFGIISPIVLPYKPHDRARLTLSTAVAAALEEFGIFCPIVPAYKPHDRAPLTRTCGIGRLRWGRP